MIAVDAMGGPAIPRRALRRKRREHSRAELPGAVDQQPLRLVAATRRAGARADRHRRNAAARRVVRAVGARVHGPVLGGLLSSASPDGADSP